MRKQMVAAVCAGILVLGLVSMAEAALLSRLSGQAYYDDVLDITWAADAGLSGADIWANQVAWAAGVTIGGVSGWRLPSADVNGDTTVVGCSPGGVTGCADNEMGYLYWEEGITSAAPSPFSNVQANGYWSGTVVDPSVSWSFYFSNGNQGGGDLVSASLFAWAVHDGDVAAVPAPSALLLFGTGIAGLIGLRGWSKKTA